MTLRVLFENDELLAVDKRSGETVIPSRDARDGPPLLARVTAAQGRAVFVVHRLDRGTSGVVLFAKTEEAHKIICGQFETRGIKKTYLACVWGTPRPAEGVVREPLKEFGSGRMGVSPGGKDSVTIYRVKEGLNTHALLEVEPQTGRRHQIRVHLYRLGHPVLGDDLYGRPRPVGGVERLMLHASRITLKDSSGATVEIASPLPPDFTAVLERLRRN